MGKEGLLEIWLKIYLFIKNQRSKSIPICTDYNTEIIWQGQPLAKQQFVSKPILDIKFATMLPLLRIWLTQTFLKVPIIATIEFRVLPSQSPHNARLIRSTATLKSPSRITPKQAQRKRTRHLQTQPSHPQLCLCDSLPNHLPRSHKDKSARDIMQNTFHSGNTIP